MDTPPAGAAWGAEGGDTGPRRSSSSSPSDGAHQVPEAPRDVPLPTDNLPQFRKERILSPIVQPLRPVSPPRIAAPTARPLTPPPPSAAQGHSVDAQQNDSSNSQGALAGDASGDSQGTGGSQQSSHSGGLSALARGAQAVSASPFQSHPGGLVPPTPDVAPLLMYGSMAGLQPIMPAPPGDRRAIPTAYGHASPYTMGTTFTGSPVPGQGPQGQGVFSGQGATRPEVVSPKRKRSSTPSGGKEGRKKAKLSEGDGQQVPQGESALGLPQGKSLPQQKSPFYPGQGAQQAPFGQPGFDGSQFRADPYGPKMGYTPGMWVPQPTHAGKPAGGAFLGHSPSNVSTASPLPHELQTHSPAPGQQQALAPALQSGTSGAHTAGTASPASFGGSPNGSPRPGILKKREQTPRRPLLYGPNATEQPLQPSMVLPDAGSSYVAVPESEVRGLGSAHISPTAPPQQPLGQPPTQQPIAAGMASAGPPPSRAFGHVPPAHDPSPRKKPRKQQLHQAETGSESSTPQPQPLQPQQGTHMGGTNGVPPGQAQTMVPQGYDLYHPPFGAMMKPFQAPFGQLYPTVVYPPQQPPPHAIMAGGPHDPHAVHMMPGGAMSSHGQPVHIAPALGSHAMAQQQYGPVVHYLQSVAATTQAVSSAPTGSSTSMSAPSGDVDIEGDDSGSVMYVRRHAPSIYAGTKRHFWKTKVPTMEEIRHFERPSDVRVANQGRRSAEELFDDPRVNLLDGVFVGGLRETLDELGAADARHVDMLRRLADECLEAANAAQAGAQPGADRLDVELKVLYLPIKKLAERYVEYTNTLKAISSSLDSVLTNCNNAKTRIEAFRAARREQQEEDSRRRREQLARRNAARRRSLTAASGTEDGAGSEGQAVPAEEPLAEEGEQEKEDVEVAMAVDPPVEDVAA